MSRHERYGTRDLAFSGWHRTLPDYCTAIDLDLLEYCHKCRKPLALIEIARDVGQEYKPTRILKELAKVSGIDAYLILYTKEGDSIGDCRMSRIWPNKTPLYDVTAEVVALKIQSIHQQCCPLED